MKAVNWLKVLLALPLATLLSLSSLPANAAEGDLHFMAWPDYIDTELVEKFEKQSGVNIVIQQYISDEQRDTLMSESKGEGYDIILVNGLVLEDYVRSGWTTALPKGYSEEKLTNVDKRWWHAYQAAEWYAVPYFWGTLGIAYRPDLVETPITSWMQLLKPAKAQQGKVSVHGSSRETIGMTLKALNHSLNTRSSAKVGKAVELLNGQFDHYQVHPPMDSTTYSKMISDHLHAAMMYSSSAQILQRLDNRVKYIIPKEGGSIWVDYLVVSSKSKNKQAAWDFIEFLNEPEHAMQLAYYLDHATPNKGAEALLDDAFLNNKTIYPDPGALKKSEILQPLLSRTQKKWEEQFSTLGTN